jgi:hypothetical protein
MMSSARMFILTNGLTSQPIGPHNDLLTEFAFLRPPNALPL